MRRRQLLKTVGAGVTAAGVATLPAAADGSYTDEYYDGVHYTKYVPSGASGGEPLVVMLHGCSQEPDEFAAATGMNDVADQEGFAVVYPDQSSFSNAFDCWNWYYDANTDRGSGEGESITNIALEAADAESLDTDRIYVAGFSAGAAMVPNLMVSYADVFAAGGIHSGLEYDAADTATTGTYAMTWGGPDPYNKAEDAYEAMQEYGVTGRVPTIVFHGESDLTVNDTNGDQARTQAVETNDLVAGGGVVTTDPDDRVYNSTGGYDYRRDRYTDAQGRVNVEYWLVDDMGHEWSGGDAGSFAAPDAPEASTAMWEFFDRWSN